MINLKLITGNIQKRRETILAKLRRLRREDPFSSEDRALIVDPGTDASVLFGHEQVVVLEGRLKSDLKRAAIRHAVDNDTTLQQVFNLALERYLSERAEKNSKKLVFLTHDLKAPLDNLTRDDYYDSP